MVNTQMAVPEMAWPFDICLSIIMKKLDLCCIDVKYIRDFSVDEYNK
jgi:hypothetical protein